MYAAENGHDDIVCLLINKEAGIQDNDGMTALMFASKRGHSSCVDLLIGNDEVNIRDKHGENRSHVRDRGRSS